MAKPKRKHLKILDETESKIDKIIEYISKYLKIKKQNYNKSNQMEIFYLNRIKQIQKRYDNLICNLKKDEQNIINCYNDVCNKNKKLLTILEKKDVEIKNLNKKLSKMLKNEK
ncbi:hypothetical protein DMUE_3045 [Dictyocoela muelleri]|nr:hypothetical protein DMUE_3045 [Dictyocoela muelleri]